ncbi:pyruvate dehydrogenase (acetyl-transferring) E1 component subunit alpha [Mechercharimyces sp. CAU 1602]|uniref:pyruvate dehydrogenase (acetyl-transferring) E1 component subunit alpha n=1 Tax=Mechercharimyces sp. CAU 1602 TaxID=2973933 RepID=UPI002161F1D0|nr:pyruvate dehydrogenase (acetyl-transferring) E1 component subunit alpha [Mechercharimyces sp. CAU 1602]MCS1351951.1 pyruvate dehydrogenase (acetyl-transferring) E1 component subunit alpha [Mechercharimyces sp. CAU 1602]
MAYTIQPKPEVEMFQILNPDGEINKGKELPNLSNEEMVDLYRWMLTLRTFDGRAIKLNRQGRLGFYAPLGGQEACQIGAVAALNKTDWLYPSYRDMGSAMYHGLPMEQVFLYSRGQIGGGKMPEDVNVFPPQIIIAGHLLHGMGTAWAFKLRGEEHVTISMFGDGATSQGDFHEALNFAAVYDAPTIFFCQNNQYAISVPIEKQMKSETIAQKAIAYGIPGVQVDGNDIFAVYQAVKEAAERGRKGEGPTLIEAVTYRFGPHTMAGDDPRKYRQEDEESTWKERDPLKRMRQHLERNDLWSEEQEKEHEESVLQRMSEAIKKVEGMSKGAIEDVIDDVYAESHADLSAQKEAYVRWKGENK